MKRVISGVLIIALSACAVQKTLVPTGGSKADGTVELSYEFGEFEKPQVDRAQGVHAAQQRCAAWGYEGAEPFGGQKSQCQQLGGMSGCMRTLVTVQYQCTGSSASH